MPRPAASVRISLPIMMPTGCSAIGGWAMAGELAVTRERLDSTVERLLAARQVLDRQLIDA
jgi:hypothetical protein